MNNSVKSLVEKIATGPTRPLISPLLRFSAFALECQNRPICNYDRPQRHSVMDLVRQVLRERHTLLTPGEAYAIYSAVERTAKVPGALAEVGVYQGGSSKLICEAKRSRHLHLFDTFSGLPDRRSEDDLAHFVSGNFACELESVQRYLSPYRGVTFHKGIFPGTAGTVSGEHFSFVHLDVDLYECTKESLWFFYPRMSPGGIIMSHDYVSSAVRRAFDEFFAEMPEPVIELAGDQCMVVKLA